MAPPAEAASPLSTDERDDELDGMDAERRIRENTEKTPGESGTMSERGGSGEPLAQRGGVAPVRNRDATRWCDERRYRDANVEH